jgi:hypothetical protein
MGSPADPWACLPGHNIQPFAVENRHIEVLKDTGSERTYYEIDPASAYAFLQRRAAVCNFACALGGGTPSYSRGGQDESE